jgi:hypothetical protein
MTTAFSSRPGDRTAVRQLGLGIVELLLVAGLYVGYRLGRLLTVDREESARAHARLVHHLEGVLQLPSEAAIQHAVHSVRLLEAANVYYLSAHFPVTIAFLVWGFVARPRPEYLWARRLLVVLTLLGLVAHILFPLAPPRMFPRWGFLDTMTTYGPSAYDGASGALVNQYAAMPSLHIGWAVLIAVVVCRTGPQPVAYLACLHALTTIAVVTVTANHWLLDGLVAVALLGVALLVVPRPATAARALPGEPEEPAGCGSTARALRTGIGVMGVAAAVVLLS